MKQEIPQVAFYYPNPIWRHGDWVKNLILFFDGIALLVPNYMRDKPEQVDPAIVTGLREHGLLHILEPEKVVDKAAAQDLALVMDELFASGALDALDAETAFHELSYSRLGGVGDPALAEMILAELKSRGLARESEDGVSIPVHPTVRSLVLVLLAQILRPKGESLGLDLSPATDRPEVVQALEEFLSLQQQPSAGHVVSLDLLTVGVDLSAIPINEILEYRSDNRTRYRAYSRSVRETLRDLSKLEEPERADVLQDRQAELEDLASDLRKESSRAWKRPAAFALSIAGAIWNVATGDPLGGALAVSSALVGARSKKKEAGAYSYLFAAPGGPHW